MDAFSPEFAQQWLAGQESASEGLARGTRDDSIDSLSAAQQEALEELCERVSAARTVY